MTPALLAPTAVASALGTGVAAAAPEPPTLGTLAAVVATTLVVVGVFFLGIGVVGLLRLPNVYNRMHATSKATTLGAASTLLAGFVVFGPAGAGLTSLVGIVFLFLTAPTGAHLISQAAQRMGVDFERGVTWPGDEAGDPEAAAAEEVVEDAADGD
jgi:multicomponent Na+:H+ antiporter subunit G